MKTGSFRIVPVTCAEGTYRDTYPGCRGNRGMAAGGVCLRKRPEKESLAAGKRMRYDYKNTIL